MNATCLQLNNVLQLNTVTTAETLNKCGKWRYNMSMGLSDTTTIRVTKATRDVLAQRASERGISVAALVAEFAEEERRRAVFASERSATRQDLQNTAVEDELADWEQSLEDGFD